MFQTPMGVAFRSLLHLHPSSPLIFLTSSAATLPSFTPFQPSWPLFSFQTHQPPALHRSVLLAVLSAWEALPQVSTWLFLSPHSSCCSVVTFSARSSPPPIEHRKCPFPHPHTPKAPFLLKFIP